MIIVIAAGIHKIEHEIAEAAFDQRNKSLYGVPKGLLALGGKPSLSWTLPMAQSIEDVFIVTSAQK